MSNQCRFVGNIIGKTESVDKAFEIFANEYNTEEPFLCNIYEVYKDSEKQLDNNCKVIRISGTCGWSIESAMMPNGKYRDWEKCQTDPEYAKPYSESFVKGHATNLVDLSKDLYLCIELVGYEPIEQFSEHIGIVLGDVEEYNITDYREYYINSLNTYEEFLRAYKREAFAKNDVTEEIFEAHKNDGDLYICVGGFRFNDQDMSKVIQLTNRGDDNDDTLSIS